MSETIDYVAAGRRFSGILATPRSRAIRGGVLVLHGGAGIGDHERARSSRLAELGFVVLAPDLFGETFADRAHGLRVIGRLVGEPAELRLRTGAALQRLRDYVGVNTDRMAAIGHCFGGLAALELARSGGAIAAAVSVHGGLATRAPARPGEVAARILVCTGADDPYCPRAQRIAFEDEMTAAGVDSQHHVYAGARHGFSVAGDAGYHALADQRAWRATLGLLDEVM